MAAVLRWRMRGKHERNICPFFITIFNFSLVTLTSPILLAFTVYFSFHLKDRFGLLIAENCWCTCCVCLMCLGPYVLRTSRVSRCFYHTERKAARGDIIWNIHLFTCIRFLQPGHATRRYFWKGKHYERMESGWWIMRHKCRGKSMNRIAMISHHFAGVLKNLWRQLENKIYVLFTNGFPVHMSRSISKQKWWITADGECWFVLKSVCSFRATEHPQHPHTTPGHGIHSNIFINMQALSDQ